MKARKTLKYQNLIQEVITIVQSRFSPKVSDIKKVRWIIFFNYDNLTIICRQLKHSLRKTTLSGISMLVGTSSITSHRFLLTIFCISFDKRFTYKLYSKYFKINCISNILKVKIFFSLCLQSSFLAFFLVFQLAQRRVNYKISRLGMYSNYDNTNNERHTLSGSDSDLVGNKRQLLDKNIIPSTVLGNIDP